MAGRGEVCLSVTRLQTGDAEGNGQVVAVRWRGWLPYPMHWQGRLVEKATAGRWALRANWAGAASGG